MALVLRYTFGTTSYLTVKACIYLLYQIRLPYVSGLHTKLWLEYLQSIADELIYRVFYRIKALYALRCAALDRYSLYYESPLYGTDEASIFYDYPRKFACLHLRLHVFVRFKVVSEPVYRHASEHRQKAMSYNVALHFTGLIYIHRFRLRLNN